MNVVSLDDPPTINDTLIAILEEVLDKTRQGQIISGACMLVYKNGDTGNVFTDSEPLKLITETVILQRDIIDSCIDLRMHRAGEHY